MKQLLCKLRVRLPIDGLLSKSYFKTICISRRTHSSDNFRVNIGDVTLIRTLPKNFELVPVNYGSEKANKSQSLLHHLRWMMQKDKLSQDIFLIGPPGALKRTLAMQYLELTKKEVEYISLSRDTTESDIKQRREIKDKTAHYVDQCAVRAAIEGRTLILDGIEKAERNVLPILNNLLENREMQLEDGRFLMAANRYDKLLQTYTKDEMDKMNLVRVSEAFQVIGLGLPVPRYRGNPLDPPLRSRFQARDINPLPFQEHLEILKSFGPSVPEDCLILVLSAAYTLNSSESKSLGLPDFPLDQLPSLVKMMEKIPGVSLHQLINLVYPHELFLGKEGQVSVSDAFSKFDIYPEKVGKTPEINVSMEDSSSGLDSHIVANVAEKSRKTLKYKVLAGTSKPKSSSSVDENFVDTKYLKHLFAEIMHSHTVKDFCLIGPKGCGKSAMIKKFADSLGYESELITLYTDMTARDLLQQRITHPNGDTDWKFAPLVMAALNGNLAILDGLHRINAGTLAVIHRLVHDREVQLFSGDRLLRSDRYDKMKHHNEWTDEDLRQKGIYRIHPAFRLVALSEPPVIGSSTQQWLNAELLTLFFFHHMRPLSAEEELQVIAGVAKTDKSKIKTIVGLTHALRSANDLTLQSVASSLSLRQLIRIAKRMEMHSSESEYNAIQKACLGRFLPPLTKLALNQMLQEFNINTPQVANSSLEGFDRAITSEVKQGRVRIGSTEHDVFVTDSKAQVPDVLFYDNVQHLTVMEDMLKDFTLGEHLLLVGNQGVGKNKIVDRFLYLLNRPREYIQLHRDTTIQSLTLQPTVQDGVIKYEDSPLVRAVKFGRVLVIDEADKAPTNVTCILKALVESGNMLLADGRRIMKYTDEIQGENIIQMHPNFRMIVLANRPGFPFLGNDFFGALGDIFSCHAVDNPSMESEVEMLKKYGPSVPEAVVRKLVEAFDELRSMADQGLIAYPYSTREIVNIVKHLEAYPNEALTTVVRNVFDFDPYSEEMWETLKHTLQKHGIPIGLDASRINLAKEYLLSKPTLISTWDVKRQCSENGREDAVLPVRRRKLSQKYYPDLDVVVDVMDRIDSRTLVFSEEEAHWKVPISENNIILDVAVTKNGNQMKDMIHIATGNPVQLFSMIPASRNINVLDVFRVFSYSRGAYQPKIQLAALSNKLAGHIVLHEGISNRLFLIDPLSGAVSQLEIDSLLEATGKQIISRVQGLDKGFYRMCSDLADKNMIALYQNNGRELQMMNLDSNEVYEVTLPFAISNIKLASPDHWLVVDRETNRKHLIKKPSEQDDARLLYNINEQPPSDVMSNMSTEGLSPDSLKTALDRNVSAPNRVFNSCDSYATIAIGFPDLEPGLEVYSYQRPSKWVFPDIALHPKFVFHSGPAQIISAVPKRFHPDYKKDDIQQQLSSAHLEVVDLGDKKVRYIPIPVAQNIPPYSTWLSEVSPSHVLISGTSNDGLVSVDAGGGVRLWETAVANLTSSLDSWMKIRGTNENEKLQLTVDAPAPDLKDLDDPKHGKIDPKNVPHVGGSMWAGGTGGRSTAGLGGIGGPYRLDAGHDVHQVPDYVKENVPEEVKRAAREMGQRAYKERLRQIKMSEYDAELYEQLISNIKLHIQSLKVILDSLQAKSKERQWLKHQTYGELDDLKLIDSLTGEKSVFKRRGDKEPEMGAPQEKPKRLKLLVDVSGSMYRFNGYDGRLHRIMESALLVMEAFEKYNDKFQYDIVGHSGEEYALPFVTQNNVPANNKEKLDILKQMHAHAQFCMSGDHTLEAIVHATESLSKEDADERFVIILSDANLDRYGIRPKSLTKVLMTNSDVNAFAIFIGSLGDQAARLQKALPSGRGFVCLDTKLIPDILRQIFTSSLLQK